MGGWHDEVGAEGVGGDVVVVDGKRVDFLGFKCVGMWVEGGRGGVGVGGDFFDDVCEINDGVEGVGVEGVVGCGDSVGEVEGVGVHGVSFLLLVVF